MISVQCFEWRVRYESIEGPPKVSTSAPNVDRFPCTESSHVASLSICSARVSVVSHHCCSCHVGLKPVLCATQPKIRVVARSECQSCFVRCAVLCALPRRAVAVSLPVPVRLLVSCVTVTFRLFFSCVPPSVVVGMSAVRSL